jgi:ribonuclease J
MNMNLYGHDGQWLMVDCGVSFEKKEGDSAGIRGNDVFSAEPSFIAKQRDRLAGIVITHAHEDHVGAVAHLWPRLKAPVFTTPFTAEVLRRKLAQANLLDQVELNVVPLGATKQIGHFQVSWFHITHSLPEPQALIVSTLAGNVFHTADWKLDPNPLVGRPFDKKKIQALAKENINAIVCDSTNALVEGWSESEANLHEGLQKIVSKAKGRVVVACFGSNVARLQTLAKIAQETQRQFGVLGRSLTNMISIAKTTHYWPEALKVVQSNHLGYLPPDSVLAVATGSQGEPRTALSRLASDNLFDMDLDKGDTVIFSSKVIPGNESAVKALIAKLKIKGVEVIEAKDSEAPIHASGHPHEDELRSMYNWVQPQLAIPVHGEMEHMQRNAEIAKQSHVPRQLTGTNGDLFIIAPQPKLKKGAAATGQICLSRD